jgi:hypothetical protein
MKQLLLLVFLLLTCTLAIPFTALLQDMKTLLAKEYCPMFDLHGRAHCPVGVQDVSKTWNKAHILGAGTGYNKNTRSLRFPIFKPNNLTSVTRFTLNKFYSFHTLSDFLSVLQNDKEIQGGVFAENTQWLDSFLLNFADYTGNLTISQIEYYTHKSTMSSQYTTQFQTFLQELPDTFDSNNQTHVERFELFFELFGTGVALKAWHGGLIYRQNMVKKCYSANLKEEFIKELEHNITKEPLVPCVYMRFRTVGLLNIHGGNPELFDAQERIETFAKAPALLRFDYKSLDQVVLGKPSIKPALEYYNKKHDNEWFIKIQKRVQEEQIKRWYAPSSAHIFALLSVTHPTCNCINVILGGEKKMVLNGTSASSYEGAGFRFTLQKQEVIGNYVIVYNNKKYYIEKQEYWNDKIFHVSFDCEHMCFRITNGCAFTCNCAGY